VSLKSFSLVTSLPASSPLRRLLAKLPGAKQSGGNWSARCPAHEDQRASLSIGEGDDGRALVKCHAGCTTDNIVTALGLTLRDLMPERDALTPARAGKFKSEAPTFRTARDAVAALERQNGKCSKHWTYHDAAGEPVGLVVRWDLPDGKKDIRPVARHTTGWRIGAMPDPRPLYALPSVTKTNRVIVCEGEKCADAVRGIGFTATTCAGGSQAASKTDWTPLAGKEVWILPDNDPPGRKYAEAVAAILYKLNLPAVVKIIVLPDLPEKGDIVDWVEAHGDAAKPAGMRHELEALAEAVAPTEAPPNVVGTPRAVPDVLCMADVEPGEVPWLWLGRIPLGRITLLVGRPGAGKSFLTCDIAARLSNASPWPDGGSAPLGDTLVIAAEDDPADTIAPRLIGAGADRRRVHLLRAVKLIESNGKETAVAFDLGNVELIRNALRSRPDCRLVVVDPIGSYLGSRVDAHRDNEVRGVLAPLAALAAEMNVAVLLVCHTRKAVSSHADDAALGSRAFVGLARSVLHLSADDTDRDRKLLLPGKCNLGKPADGLAYRIVGDPPRLEWESAPLEGLRADDVLTADPGGGRRGPKPTAKLAAVDWLADLLRDGPVLKTEIEKQAEDAGLSWATVRRAQEPLAIVPYKETFSGRWYWKLPGGVAAVCVRSLGINKKK
jgi:hypothetical protein